MNTQKNTSAGYCLENHEPVIIPDIEDIKEEYPEEYVLYQRLDAKSVIAVPFWKGPTGFLVLRNAKRYRGHASFLRMLNYAVISSLNEHYLLETRKLTIISPRITNDLDIYISLFGEIKITTSKGVLTEHELKSPKIARLLVYLLLKRKTASSPREIATAIWPEEDVELSVKNIKGLVYRFRQAFELLSDYRLIESTASGYQINPKLNVFTDCQLFDKKWSVAMKASDAKEKTEFLKKAIDLYQGALFSSARYEHWIMSAAVAFEYRYFGAVSELLKTLDQAHDYVAVQHYAAKALHIAPHSIDAYYWMILAMNKLDHPEMARGELRMAQRNLLAEEYNELLERLKASGFCECYGITPA